MRLIPSDPDIETLVRRIDSDEIDLQPEFQRGDIWPVGKRQRLIDSVLRDWHVPPIHLILEEDSQKLSVLDGQQRLSAIRGFIHDEFAIDGRIQPFSPITWGMHGQRFSQLSHEQQRRFLRFSIRIFTLVDFEPAEPGELFYRLNHLSSLTAAEQRNAFFGETRRQVKRLVDQLEVLGLAGGVFGFSNARMAYDDVLARALYVLESRTLRVKATSSALADRYRKGEEFSENSVAAVSRALVVMAESQRRADMPLRLNKATAQSWLVFFSVAMREASVSSNTLSSFMEEFEQKREQFVARGLSGEGGLEFIAEGVIRIPPSLSADAMYTYVDRSTSRVADVMSVTLRDLVIWLFFFDFLESRYIRYSSDNASRQQLYQLVNSGCEGVFSVDHLAFGLDWGVEL
ncbi:DUF262 domain-containing protein [Cognatilysobacter tabacisoli]|uniref:DUF262 domain-containing protein n=1 Tax=Cognatilysobacter tabacisoli TaxID=2315424 RepID=UPI00130067B3|nr:DUF262 domain-containing protein [Lysobacter tabacisoli]